MIIDAFAQNYNYTHDQVFSLDWNFVYTLQYIHAKQQEIQRKAAKLRRMKNK